AKDRHAAVVRRDVVTLGAWRCVPPDVVAVTASAAARENLSAVARAPQRTIGDQNVIRVVRRHANPNVITRAPNQPAIPTDVGPRRAAIVRTPERSLRLRRQALDAVRAGLNQRIHAQLVRGRDRDVRLAKRRFRQAWMRYLRKRLASVL